MIKHVDNYNEGQLHVGTFPGHNVEALPPATSFELGTSASLGVTSDQYGSMQAGTRDIRYNPSLTDPAHYIGGPAVANGPFLSMSGTGHHQQRVNEWPEALLSEYHLLLKRISDSLDLEQVKGLCYVSVEAEKAGICNRNDFSGIVLLDFFDKMMLITPSNLIYLARMLLLLIGWTCAVSLTSTMVGC
ncbi:uncharacterized protein [Dysidea avara]|uniref:uncharacterized protein n=1 Tax=Dysidea avara TaxID=196820 RepID=UPI00332ACB55